MKKLITFGVILLFFGSSIPVLAYANEKSILSPFNDVTIQIRGGWKLKVEIKNSGTSEISAYTELFSARLIIPGTFNDTEYGTVTSGETDVLSYTLAGISRFNITASAANETVSKKGLSFFGFVVLT